MGEPHSDMELPETRAPSVKPSCHLGLEITVSNLLCRVALKTMLFPKALLWVINVTGCWMFTGCNSKERKKY